jgi:hypothetical protein
LPHLAPPTADDRPVLDYFHKQAVLMLRSAVAGGSYDATTIEANEAFAPLRGRADFDALLGELRRKPAGK